MTETYSILFAVPFKIFQTPDIGLVPNGEGGNNLRVMLMVGGDVAKAQDWILATEVQHWRPITG